MLKIYEESATTFSNNGIATLHPYKALVYKEDNGDYYIEIESPVEDYQYLQQGRIVRAETPWGWQGFRLQNPLRTSHRVKVKGKHLFFDSANYAINYANIDNKTASGALTVLNQKCDTTTPFTFDGTDVTTIISYDCTHQTLESGISNVLERSGGHLDRNNWNVAIKSTIGQDRGVVLSYGKNIKELEADEDWSEVCTKILPVGKDGINVDSVLLESTEQYKIPYTKIVEFQQDIEQLDGESTEDYRSRLKADLKAQAENYLLTHHTPKVNYKVKAHLREITDVGDVIRVKHPKCNIKLVTNVIKVVYDTIQKKYTEVEFGNFRRSLNDLISTVTQSAIESAKKESATVRSDLSVHLQNAKDEIFALLKDSHIIYEGDKILAVDKLPKEEATNVMMISLGGISFSQSGINGPFTSAWTLDGTLDMANIHVINLTADMIDVTDLNAFGATIGGWNIDEQAIYKDYFNDDGSMYRAYYQAPGMSTDDINITEHMILSSQYFNSSGDIDWNQGFYLTVGGNFYGKRIETIDNIETNVTGKNTFAGLTHNRNGCKGRFGIGGVGTSSTIALEHVGTDGIIDCRLDFYSPFTNINAIRSMRYKSNDAKGNATYYYSNICFFEDSAIYLCDPDGDNFTTSNCLDLLCKDINCRNIQAEKVAVNINGKSYDVGGTLKVICNALNIDL